MELTEEEQLAQAIAMSLNEASTTTTGTAPPPIASTGAASSSAEQPPPPTSEAASSAASVSISSSSTATSSKSTDAAATEAPAAPKPAEEPNPSKKQPIKDPRFSLAKPAEPISVDLLDAFVQRTLIPACLHALDQLTLSSPVLSSSSAASGPAPPTSSDEYSGETSAVSADNASAIAVSNNALRLMGRAPDSGSEVAAAADAPVPLSPSQLKQALVHLSDLLITSLRRYDRQLRATAAEISNAQQPTSLSSIAPSMVIPDAAGPSTTSDALSAQTPMDTSNASVSSTKKPEEKAEKLLEPMVLKANDVRDQLLQQLVSDLLSLLSEIRVNATTADEHREDRLTIRLHFIALLLDIVDTGAPLAYLLARSGLLDELLQLCTRLAQFARANTCAADKSESSRLPKYGFDMTFPSCHTPRTFYNDILLIGGE